jgi:uncharacterized protein YebE (UPF0316 family)
MSEADLYSWVVLPTIIFFARIGDVSIGTMRMLFTMRGRRMLAPVCGFFEVLIWIFVMREIMLNVNNVAACFAWAIGYAAGNLVGMTLEEKIALGKQIIRIITAQPAERLLEILKDANLSFTIIDGHGSRGPVKIIFTVIERKNRRRVEKLITAFDPKAFYSIGDIRSATAREIE